MKAVLAAFIQKKALVGAFSVIVKTDCETVLYPRLCVTTVPRSVISNHSHSLMILFFPTITLSLLVLPREIMMGEGNKQPPLC